MKSRWFLSTLLGFAAVCHVAAQSQGDDVFDSIRSRRIYEDLLQSFSNAKSLRAEFEVRSIGVSLVAPDNAYQLYPIRPSEDGQYVVELMRSGSGRIQAPSGITFLTSQSILTNGQSYVNTPQNQSRLFSNQALTVWGMFFNPKSFKNVYRIKNVGTRQRKEVAMVLLEITVDAQRTRTVNLYLEPKSNHLLQTEFISDDHNGHRHILLMDIKSMEFNVDMTEESLRPKPDGL